MTQLFLLPVNNQPLPSIIYFALEFSLPHIKNATQLSFSLYMPDKAFHYLNPDVFRSNISVPCRLPVV